MLNQKIKEIKERLSKARPSPWKSYIEGRDHYGGDNFIMIGESPERNEDIHLHGATDADQDFIAHARQDIPFLIQEIEKLINLHEN